MNNNSKMIQCNVCNLEVAESDWVTHIYTVTHRNGALHQIIEDDIDSSDSYSNDVDLSDTRDETAEFLEELKQDFVDGKL